MYKVPVIFFALLMITSCSSTQVASIDPLNTLSKKEMNNGWKLLFDGKTTNGWHTYGKQTAGKVWKVEDGALHTDAAVKKSTPAEGGDLVTDEEFDNFDLKLEWKISKNGNSGIIFYVKEDAVKYKESYHTGPEMQVLDNDGHPDGKIFKHHTGDLYDLIASSKDMSRPVGQWNQAEIIANQGKLDFYLNGEHVVNTTMWDDNWRKMVAASKFKEWPDFGTFRKGRIDLQDHGDEVWYRNIKIKRL